ncbi:MAG TPA: hypothetical protein VGR26_02740 [Acidimicrobiales bacterium]|nr:hypothetical protein [Acidimicrobiales bacterium]
MALSIALIEYLHIRDLPPPSAGSSERLTGYSLGATLGAFVQVVGLIMTAAVASTVNIYLGTTKAQQLRTLELKLRYIDTQMARLWGPLLGDLQAFQTTYELLQEQLPMMGPNQEQTGRLRQWRSFTIWQQEAEIWAGHAERASLRKARRWPLSLPSKLAGPPSLISLAERDPFCDQPTFAQWKPYLTRYFLPRNARIVELIRNEKHLIGDDSLVVLDMFVRHAAELQARFDKFSDSAEPSIPEDMGRWPFGPLTEPYPARMDVIVLNKLLFLRALAAKYRAVIAGQDSMARHHAAISGWRRFAYRRLDSLEAGDEGARLRRRSCPGEPEQEAS